MLKSRPRWDPKHCGRIVGLNPGRNKKKPHRSGAGYKEEGNRLFDNAFASVDDPRKTILGGSGEPATVFVEVKRAIRALFH